MITLSKIAKLANVSISTASKAFSGSNEVNEETRNLIFDIAKQHGCFKKFYNVKYPKLVFAVIAPEFDSAYYTRYISFIRKYLDKDNCELCVSTTDFSAEREKELLEYYFKHSNVDGVIIINSHLDTIESLEIPIVFINPINSPSVGVAVFSDTNPALSQAIDHLVQHKIDSVGFIGEGLTGKKLDIFRKALEQNDIGYDERLVSVSSDRFEAGGYSAMQRLISGGNIPRAVVCAYDYMAIGAIKCIYDNGLTVPEDIAVLGFDDIEQAMYLNPPLASVSTPTEELCQMAVDSIIKQINGEPTVTHQFALSEFKLRRSFEFD